MILSRSFCNTCIITDLKEIRSVFENGVQAIREQEKECETYARYFRARSKAHEFVDYRGMEKCEEVSKAD